MDKIKSIRALMVAPMRPSADGPTVNVHGQRVPMFLRQQHEINGSPAALCVLMALLALGDIPRDECLKLATAGPAEQFRRVWPWIVRDYLVGADTNELGQLIGMLSSVRSSFTFAKNGRAARWILSQLNAGRWVIVGFDSERPTLEHWGLVVGYAALTRSRVPGFTLPEVLRTIYLLDPNLSIARDAVWNASFTMDADRPGAFSEVGRRPYVARLCGAVSVHGKSRFTASQSGGAS